METDADHAGFQVARADDEHGVDFALFGVGDLGVDRVGAEVGFHAHLAGAKFLGDGFRVFHERGRRRIAFRTDGEDANLFGREPEREVVGAMIEQACRTAAGVMSCGCRWSQNRRGGSDRRCQSQINHPGRQFGFSV